MALDTINFKTSIIYILLKKKKSHLPIKLWPAINCKIYLDFSEKIVHLKIEKIFWSTLLLPSWLVPEQLSASSHNPFYSLCYYSHAPTMCLPTSEESFQSCMVQYLRVQTLGLAHLNLKPGTPFYYGAMERYLTSLSYSFFI